MKFKKITILTLITTALLGLTIFSIKKTGIKPKTMQTNAETAVIFDGAEIKFNETLDITNINRINLLQFYYDGKFYNYISNDNGVINYGYDNRDLQIGYEISVYDHYSLSNQKWENEDYRKIKITSLTHIQNNSLAIDYLQQNCELISRRPNTLENTQIKLNYRFYSSVEYTNQLIEEKETYTINFLNGNGGQYTKFEIYYYDDYPTNQTSNIRYIDADNNINIAYTNIYDISRDRPLPSNKFEATSRYETYLRITDGANVTNTNLINQLWGNSIEIAPYYPEQYTQEVINIRDLMLEILTMPFSFINQAFDVTLWPGTQYAFNFSNFIKGMLAIAALLFIIRLFTSGFSITGNYVDKAQTIAKNKADRQLTKAKIENTNARTAATKLQSHERAKKILKKKK